MRDNGVGIISTGGETADVGDLVRTVIVDSTVTARMKRSGRNLQRPASAAGDVVVGLASYGKATYETEYNGGMGSNGLTSARHDVFAQGARRQVPGVLSVLRPETGLTVGKLVLSPAMRAPPPRTDVEPETGMTVGKLVLAADAHVRPGGEEAARFHGSERHSRHGALLRRAQ